MGVSKRGTYGWLANKYDLRSFPGGGVLAHTILGVDFNDQTGDIRSVNCCTCMSP